MPSDPEGSPGHRPPRHWTRRTPRKQTSECRHPRKRGRPRPIPGGRHGMARLGAAPARTLASTASISLCPWKPTSRCASLMKRSWTSGPWSRPSRARTGSRASRECVRPATV